MWILCLTLIILAITAYYRCWRDKMIIKRWRAALVLDEHQMLFNELYQHVDGFALSRQARKTHDAIEYIYGEIDFSSFIALLSLVKPNKKTIFYDLGSGTGKAVIACAMVFDVQESHGIELLEPLHNIAYQQQQHYYLKQTTPTCPSIQFTHDDFLTANFSSATLIYINSTGFFGEMWLAISERIAQSTDCMTVISISKPLKTNAFKIFKITSVQMSWGVVKAYIQQRIKTT